MIYSNKLKDGTCSVSFSLRDGGELTYGQFIEELTAIYLALLENEQDTEIAINVLNKALNDARETFLNRRNNYFDSRRRKLKLEKS